MITSLCLHVPSGVLAPWAMTIQQRHHHIFLLTRSEYRSKVSLTQKGLELPASHCAWKPVPVGPDIAHCTSPMEGATRTTKLLKSQQLFIWGCYNFWSSITTFLRDRHAHVLPGSLLIPKIDLYFIFLST